MIGLPFLHPNDRTPCMDNPALFYDDSWTPAEPVGRYESRATHDAEVLEVCGDCPFRLACLDWGVRHERHGYWGGFSPKKREDMRRAWGISLTPTLGPDDRDILRDRKAAERAQERRLFELEQSERAKATMAALNDAKYGRA